MEKNKLKIYNAPITFAISFMTFSLFVFLFGPIKWVDNWDWAAVCGVILIVAYIISLYFGFYIGLRSKSFPQNIQVIKVQNEDFCKSFFKFSIWIYFLITVLNAFEYANASSLGQLFDNVLKGLSDPAAVYYEKDVTSRSGNILTYVTLIMQPLIYITSVNAFLNFKKLKPIYRVILIFTVIIEAFRWLAIGTNKGLLDLIILFFVVYFINSKRQALVCRNRKSNKKMVIFLIAAVILFLMFFSYVLSDRIGGKYSKDLFATFPYNLIPNGMRVFVERFDSYLTQGYDNMIRCIRHCEWKPTFFIGNSRFLMDMVNRFTGINLFSRTYPGQLSTFGVDPLASWHSAYSWLASDLSFVGVTLFMFLVGVFFSKITREAFTLHDPISSSLFYMLILGIVNSSCTNYVLAYSNMFVGFWILFFIRIVKNNLSYTKGNWVKTHEKKYIS